ncbi:MAG: LysM peptidoglycan-binding domain-containing protein [Oscillospiraceae bacterium]|nr:LysM peptidoglycan-binding domain-containing protein [Oscillospiraceae bacterium]
MFEDYPVYHTITYGDTLYTLARNYNTTVHDIMNANPNIDPYNLRIGDVITIIPSHNMDTDIAIHTPPYSTDNEMHTHHMPDHHCISQMQFNLSKEMRLAWSQHVYWTRLLIISIVNMLKDTDNATTRVLQTAKDIADLFAPFYGYEVTNAIEKLLTEHLVIGKNLIVAATNKNATDVEKYNKEWYENADEIATAFNKINPNHYNEEEVRKMFYKHLDLTKEELSHRLNGQYDEDVKAFNKVEAEAMMMADYFVDRNRKTVPR